MGDTNVPEEEDMSVGREENATETGKKLGSRAKAINQHCKDCIYDPYSGTGTWRQQTEACTVIKCALYEFRPKSSSSIKF